MTNLYQLLNIFFVALLCCTSSSHLITSASANPVVCSGTQEAEQTGTNSFTKMKDLRERFSNCQFVIGHVHIVRIDENEFKAANKTFDFSFLDTIQEVTGCVKIMHSCFSTPLVLKNLRIIRGRNCLTGGNASLIVEANPSCRLVQPPIDMRSLHYIERGNIYLHGVADCYMQRLVSSAELFKDTRGQALFNLSNCTSLADRCHPDCSVWPGDGQRHCWGPGADQCQARSRCVSVPEKECQQQRCFVDSAGLERCCSEQCIGGCFGVQSSQCFGCAMFNRNGTCVSACSPRSLYDTATTQHVKPATKLYPYGPVCVSRCPDSFFIQDDACVSKCREGFTAAPDNRCVPTVSSNICESDSASSSLICSVKSPLMEGLTNESRLCTTFIGRFTISSTCFSPTSHSDSRQLTLAQLYTILSRLREIRGVVQVNLQDSPGITNLTFFSKLERLGRSPGDSRAGIYVHSSHVQHLGFSSLRHVIKSGINIWLLSQHLNSLNATVAYCSSFRPSEQAYVDELIEFTGSSEIGAVRIQRKIAEKLKEGQLRASCPYGLDASCHSQCDQRYGCWGPGPDACVRCLGVNAGGVCATTCGAASPPPGWFDAGRTVPLGSGNVTERVCSLCHRSCSACTGPTETDCTRCSPGLYRDGTQCVGSCNLDYQYPDADRICRQCPQVCAKVGLGLPTCTGNSTIVERGGCQFCTLIMLIERSPTNSTQVLQCLRLADSCPIGFYLSALDPNREWVDRPGQFCQFPVWDPHLESQMRVPFGNNAKTRRLTWQMSHLPAFRITI